MTLCMGVNQQAYEPWQASRHLQCLAHHELPRARRQGACTRTSVSCTAWTTDPLDTLPTRCSRTGRAKDLRRARAATLSMVPTSTGAAKAIGLVLPMLNGKLDGIAIRVPTPNVSVVDLTATVERDGGKESSVNAAMKRQPRANYGNPWPTATSRSVSVDFNGNPHSSIFDAPLTKVLGKRLVKIFSWYDNEWGYSNRLADVTAFVASKI